MPRAGKKHFPYSEKGLEMAREESARTGKPVVYTGDMKAKSKKTRKR